MQIHYWANQEVLAFQAQLIPGFFVDCGEINVYRAEAKARHYQEYKLKIYYSLQQLSIN